MTGKIFRREIIENMSPEQMARAIEFYDNVVESMKYSSRFRGMSNEELANELMHSIWAEIPMFTEASELIEEVIDRLKGGDK